MTGQAPNFQVYVRSLAGPPGRWQISTTGGLAPRWTKGGREIVYAMLDGRLMAVDIDTSAGFHPGTPRYLFTVPSRLSSIGTFAWDVDATGETLGRLATRVARVLSGKHKATWSPNLDGGDHVIVLNARRIVVSANKLESKTYMRHSGYPQGLKAESLGRLLERRPEEVVRRAIKGMLPHTRLGAQQLRKLKIYAGSDHPHQAQRPEPLA